MKKHVLKMFTALAFICSGNITAYYLAGTNNTGETIEVTLLNTGLGGDTTETIAPGETFHLNNAMRYNCTSGLRVVGKSGSIKNKEYIYNIGIAGACTDWDGFNVFKVAGSNSIMILY